jgi:hypothetical protein
MATGGEERKPTLKGRIERLGRVKAWILGLGAVATALTSVYALTTTLFPALKPSQSPTKIGATLSNLTVEPDVVLGEYLGRPREPAEAREDAANQLSEEQLRKVGNVIYFEVELAGFQRKSCYFRGSMHYADSRKSVDGFTNQLGLRRRSNHTPRLAGHSSKPGYCCPRKMIAAATWSTWWCTAPSMKKKYAWIPQRSR